MSHFFFSGSGLQNPKSIAFLYPLNRPSRVLSNQRLRVNGRLSEGWQVTALAHISKSNTDISQESPALDPFDR